MKHSIKSTPTYKTIGEVAEELGLINSKNGSLQTQTLRFWEKEFKQIKPTIRAGNRRYYSENDFKKLKMLKYLLKDRGLTIKGAKRVLNSKNSKDLDESVILSEIGQKVKKSHFVKEKIDKITKIIKEIKSLNNG